MKKNSKKAILIAMMMVACGAIGIVVDHAATYAKRMLALSPMNQRVILAPGETYTGSFTVANPAGSTEDLRYLVEVSPFTMISGEDGIDDYGGMDYTVGSAYNQIVDWVTIDNPVGVVEPNGSKTIVFDVTVPINAPAGGQYVAFLVSENLENSHSEDGVAVTEIMQMAHVLYAEVTGETVRRGDILENDFPSFLLNGALETTSRVRNEGNVHTDAEYVLQVWPLFSGEEICTNEEGPETSLVLPETERYHTQTCQLPSVGIFRAKQTVKIFGETSIVEKTIVVCPIWLLFIIIFVIFALIFYFVARARARKKAAKK